MWFPKGTEPPPGMEDVFPYGNMEHDGQGYFMHFETPSLTFLSSICLWLERKKPGLVVWSLHPGHLSDSESRRLRWTEQQFSDDGCESEWVIRLDGDGSPSFLVTALFEWRARE